MAFKNYMFLIVPSIKAITSFCKALADARADDGKISFNELLEAIGILLEELFKIAEPIIRKD
jgi:hypothetical protein